MSTLTIQIIDEDGLTPSYGAVASGGDQVLNINGDVFVHVKNADATGHTVTIAAQTTSLNVSGMGAVAKANQAVAIAAGAEAMIGPFPTRAFNDANNYVQLTYDAITSVTIAALRLPKAN